MVAQTPDPAFPTVQELSLTLSADIEIHRLWKTITEILSQRFHATRITLCLPQDPTAVSSSIENNLHQSRPWGLKAHWDYKYHFLDENTVTPKDDHYIDFATQDPTLSLDYILDSKDYHGDYWSIHAPLDGGYSSSASTASSYSSSSSSAIKHSRSSHLRGYGVHSNGTECFSNLQSLEYDPEPLLNEHTIDSILRAGKTVVLTREYVGSKTSRRRSHKARPFLSDDDDSYTDTDPSEKRMNGIEIEVGGGVKVIGLHKSAGNSGFENDAGSDMDSSSSRYDSEGSYFPPVESAISGAFSNAANFVAAQSKAGYADFVQGLNPTWSQSPAPSPSIIKEDPTINPFFFQPLTSYPAMDDDTFDPPDPLSESTEDDNCSPSDRKDPQERLRTSSRPLASTGESQGVPSLPVPSSIMANARSLIHVPLYRSTDHNNQRYLPSDIRHHRPPAMPVAIVSFLSDQIPYPPEALDILTELNPFLANQITNALRLEDMVARSKRWGDLSTSGMSEGSRANESFADSIRRKMKDTNDMAPSDLATPKADYPPANGKSGYSRSKQPSAFGQSNSADPVVSTSKSREDPQPTPNISATASSTLPPKRPTFRRDLHDGNLSVVLDRKDMLVKGDRSNTHKASDQDASRIVKAESDVSVASTPNESPFNPFMLQSPDPERFSKGNASETKQPESFYNLDSTTDEIHRSLNLLNLDITGSATCPLAPQTKKMLGKHHQITKGVQQNHIDGAVLNSWANSHRRAESSPNLPDTEGSDNPDGMWQTLQSEESDKKPVSLPNPRTAESDIGLAGQESPYFGSIHSVSPSGTSKRHLFSTSKRSGVRRRRKSVKEHVKMYQSQVPPTESPVPNSPYTPNMPGFTPHLHEASLDHPGFNRPSAFSPESSPVASPTGQGPGTFDRDYPNQTEAGSFKSRWKPPSREEFEKERAPLSRHGSGWSFNSDDTSLASPGLHHERYAAGRKQKRRHHGFSEKGVHAQIPRTRLLRMIVDAIAHHVFTLSPQTGCLTWLNQRSMQYTGIPLPHLLHKPWTGILHKDDELKFQPLFKESFEKGEMFNAQYRVRRFDGQYRWFLGRVVPVRDCGGHIVQWFGTSTDIHDQKIAELQLNRQVELELNEKKYRLLAEAIPQIVFTAAPQVGLTYANAKWFTFSGQVFEQASGLGFMDHV
ncbi:hypothetical protein EC991_008063 [Linnemannia zychae]|nr:hypothetical protein EC991_008063 [Linnemannia zychae]